VLSRAPRRGVAVLLSGRCLICSAPALQLSAHRGCRTQGRVGDSRVLAARISTFWAHADRSPLRDAIASAMNAAQNRIDSFKETRVVRPIVTHPSFFTIRANPARAGGERAPAPQKRPYVAASSAWKANAQPGPVADYFRRASFLVLM
jgi:hypothetical protein